jgi:hypothetical protein
MQWLLSFDDDVVIVYWHISGVNEILESLHTLRIVTWNFHPLLALMIDGIKKQIM